MFPVPSIPTASDVGEWTTPPGSTIPLTSDGHPLRAGQRYDVVISGAELHHITEHGADRWLWLRIPGTNRNVLIPLTSVVQLTASAPVEWPPQAGETWRVPSDGRFPPLDWFAHWDGEGEDKILMIGPGGDLLDLDEFLSRCRHAGVMPELVAGNRQSRQAEDVLVLALRNEATLHDGGDGHVLASWWVDGLTDGQHVARARHFAADQGFVVSEAYEVAADGVWLFTCTRASGGGR